METVRTNRSLNRRLGAWITRRLDGRPFRPPNHLRQACALLAAYVRSRLRQIREEPHLYGPHADRYYRDTLALEETYRKIDAILDRVYGPQPAGSPQLPSAWEERYEIDPKNRRFFRKWFREKYGG
jgi:hypothetical protein